MMNIRTYYWKAAWLSLLVALGARGDTWMMPSVVTVASPSKIFTAQVVPGQGGYGGYERAMANREKNASVTVTARRPDGTTNLVWQGKLVNPCAPVEVFVSDTGALITLDNWHNVGYGAVVVFYDPTGRLLRAWELKDLYTSDQQTQLTRSVSSIWWHAGKPHWGEGARTNAFIVPVKEGEFVFNPADGTLTSRPGGNPKPAADKK